MREQAVLFGNSRSMVGIVTQPDAGLINKKNIAAIFLNAGLVHRVGPNRMHVHLSHRLAAHGFLSVRFDHSGIGDSLSRTDNLQFPESYISEAREVMDWIEDNTGINRFCLMGLCSGAMTSYSTALRDSRVVGTVLLNARGLSENPAWIGYVENRWDMKEYIRKLFSTRGIWKTFTGRVPFGQIATTALNRFKNLFKKDETLDADAADISNKLISLFKRNLQLLWISSAEDSSLEYFKLIANCTEKKIEAYEQLSCVTVGISNHTFDTLPAQKQVIDAVENWMIRCWTSEEASSQKEFTGA